MRSPTLSASLASIALLIAAAIPASATSLTRIETGPVRGGAIVTEEAGVRVIRPLPPLRHLIINPDGRTPLNLTIEDRNVFVQHHYYGVAAEGDEGAGRFVGGYGGYGLYLPRRHRGHRHHRGPRPGAHMIHVPSAARGAR